MTESELRIGNIILTCTPGQTLMIPQLQAVVQGLTIYGDIQFNYSATELDGFTMPAKHTTGIQLTKEWFIKFGFEEINDFSYKHDGITFFSPAFGNHWLLETDFRCKRIQYVHQLQNLYFTLTGEELVL